MKIANLVRPLVRDLHAYVPGEQPKIKGLIKLNTNENPYPPSAKVLKAVQAATDARLRLYPNPAADVLREKLARLHGCSMDHIVAGNGSDELLALATRTFPDPVSGKVTSRNRVQYFNPSYSLYPVLSDIAGTSRNPVSLKPDFSMPTVAELRKGKVWDFQAALTIVTTPNAPSGRGYSNAELEALCRAQKGVIILDEAYVDFAKENAMDLALKYPHVLVSRTFSKAYCLCFQRVGYFVGNPELIAALHKMRDSYNVNGLGQAAAAATLDDLPYYKANFKKVIATRERLASELQSLGFETLPSSSNFLMVKPPAFPAKDWLEKWRDKKILVRWWGYPEVKDYLRISIGTDGEIDQLLKATRQILKTPKA